MFVRQVKDAKYALIPLKSREAKVEQCNKNLTRDAMQSEENKHLGWGRSVSCLTEFGQLKRSGRPCMSLGRSVGSHGV